MAKIENTEAARRLVVPEFLSLEECKELEFIHKSCGVVGYRPWVLSTTLCHLVATNCAHLIMPILPIRERVKEIVEEHFGREYELFTEFTGLISWTKGAKIGWHSDDNRPYLKQRHYSAVCYLNNYHEDFEGGLFHFEEGDPQTIEPTAGTIVVYTADEKNMHNVDEITDGERCTLALWFTLDKEHDEDEKLIQQLSARNSDFCDVMGEQKLEEAATRLEWPVSASSVMYNLNGSVQQDEFSAKSPEEILPVNDLRIARMTQLGFSCCFTSEMSVDEEDQPVEVLYGHKMVSTMFSSLMHALQVVQFHHFRSREQESYRGEGTRSGSEELSSDSQVQEEWPTSHTKHDKVAYQRVNNSKPETERNLPVKSGKRSKMLQTEESEIDDFLQSLEEWKVYTSKLWEQLYVLLPAWKVSRLLVNRT